MNSSRTYFGTLDQTRSVDTWTLDSQGTGVIDSISIHEYGATLSSVRWGGREVCLGLDSLEEYAAQDFYLGAVVGRYANRIAKASFTLDGKRYSLEANNGENNLHGGINGFNRKVWNSRAATADQPHLAGVTFSTHSPDGEGGFPGNLNAEISYFLVSDSRGHSYLCLYHRAEIDAPCPVNFCNHAYWNLAGEDAGHLRGHHISIPAESYVDVDSEGVPTGVLAESGCGTGHMDLRSRSDIAGRIYPKEIPGALELEAVVPAGYDHCYVLSDKAPELNIPAEITKGLGLLGASSAIQNVHMAAALEYGEAGGSLVRHMDVYTTYPGVQFYTGNFLNIARGRGGVAFPPQSALCLETQFLPDSPNQSGFPDTTLRPGEVFEHLTIHHFYEDLS